MYWSKWSFTSHWSEDWCSSWGLSPWFRIYFSLETKSDFFLHEKYVILVSKFTTNFLLKTTGSNSYKKLNGHSLPMYMPIDISCHLFILLCIVFDNKLSELKHCFYQWTSYKSSFINSCRRGTKDFTITPKWSGV